MELRVLSSLLLLFFPACQLAAQANSNAQKFSPPTRTFRFTYNFTVKGQMPTPCRNAMHELFNRPVVLANAFGPVTIGSRG